MARTTASQVKEVLLKDYDSLNNPVLTVFIESASTLVDDIATCAAARGRALSDVRLELIERWLAAHLYSVTDRPYKEKQTLDAEAVYQGETGMYLESSHYGQHARLLDTSGCLAQMDPSTGQKTVGGFWAGKTETERISYNDRN